MTEKEYIELYRKCLNVISMCYTKEQMKVAKNYLNLARKELGINHLEILYTIYVYHYTQIRMEDIAGLAGSQS